jgi:hypothetical protein
MVGVAEKVLAVRQAVRYSFPADIDRMLADMAGSHDSHLN